MPKPKLKRILLDLGLGILLASMFLYGFMDPSTCRYEEVC
jgi:hypothetical protein